MTTTATKEQEPLKAPIPSKVPEKVTRSTVWLDTLDDLDLVCVVRRNWWLINPETKMLFIPVDKVDSLDGVNFTGGLARNVRYGLVKKWVRAGVINKEHVFPNDVTLEEMKAETGRNPLSPENLAGAVLEMSPEKLAAILGDNQALSFAKAVQEIVSSRSSTSTKGGSSNVTA